MSDNPAPNTISNVKLAGNVFLRTILSAVLNFIMYFSIMLIFIFLTTKAITQIYQKGEDGNYTLVTEYVTSSSEGTTANSSSDSNQSSDSSENIASENSSVDESTQTTSDSNLVKYDKRTSIPTSANLLMNVISQVLMLISLVAIPYSVLWAQGDKDSNSVNFGHMDEDKLRGLKIGFLAGIPSYIFYCILLVAKIGKIWPNYFALYRYLNLTFMPITNMFLSDTTPNSMDVSWVLLLLILITLAVLPLTCYLAYSLGYRHISISEKIIYVDPKKKKKKRRY